MTTGVGIALVGLIGGLAALPVLSAGPALFTGLGTYTTHWSFNGLLHPWLAPILGSATRPVLIGVAAAVVGLSIQRHRDPLETLAVAGAAIVLTSPTVHPWYALWALWPALALGRWGWALATVPLLGAYAVLTTYDPATRAWSEPVWLWWLTWPPALAALWWGARGEAPIDATPTVR